MGCNSMNISFTPYWLLFASNVCFGAFALFLEWTNNLRKSKRPANFSSWNCFAMAMLAPDGLLLGVEGVVHLAHFLFLTWQAFSRDDSLWDSYGRVCLIYFNYGSLILLSNLVFSTAFRSQDRFYALSNDCRNEFPQI